MTTPIQAQSLSALTNLFANPPQYPRNPTHRVHEPLTLYIVRVPGSKDVFLTPLKPPAKATITLEAIQHCLYYLHVPTPEDEAVRESLEEKHKSQEEENDRPSVTIARKPLPTPSAKHPLPPLPQEAPYQPYQPYRPYGGLQENKPTDDLVKGPLRVDTGPDFGINRKHFSSSPQPPSLFEASGDYALSPTLSEGHSAYGINQGYSNLPAPSSSPPHRYNPSIHRNPSPPKEDFATSLGGFQRRDPIFPPVTIIRRDPTSGSQWNIGTINLLQSTFTGSPLRPVHVELTSPGYVHFNKVDFNRKRRGSGASDAESIRRAIESLSTTPASVTSTEFPTHPFARTVDFRKMAVSDLRRTVYQRTNSSDTLGQTNEPSKPGLEKNVFAFESPWNGTCTFVNSIDSKTLKLKHTIQSTASPTVDSSTANLAELRFNLGWSVLSNIKIPRHRSDEPDKLPIAHLLDSKKENFRKSFQHFRHKSRESFQRIKTNNNVDDDYNNRHEDALRDLSNINTPKTNNLLGTSSIRPSSHSPPRQRYDRFVAPRSAHPHGHSEQTLTNPTSSENEDDENRISLKLGRERAGGGFRGHSAKLGKLVIEDEGLKMCDLVVGTAMGVWWQHYGIQ